MRDHRHFFVRVLVVAMVLANFGLIVRFANKKPVVENGLVAVTGELYSSTADGRVVLKTAGHGQFVLLENELLWRVEQDHAFGHKVFTVKGETFAHGDDGRVYLLIRERVSPR